MNDKLKFYRSTLVQMTKETYQKAKLKDGVIIESIVKEADELTEAIIKKVDEFEQEKTNMWSPNYDPSYNMTTTIIDHLGFEGNKQKVNPDYLKTEPMRTIVDNGPQYQLNQKSYGTLGEHWKELIDLFHIKFRHTFYRSEFKRFIINYKDKTIEYFKDAEEQICGLTSSEIDDLVNIANNLGIEFIEDFVKACEKCEE